MSQFIAGQTIRVSVDNKTITLKIEDASKSDTVSARVEESQSPNYKVGQIYDFDRDVFAQDSK